MEVVQEFHFRKQGAIEIDELNMDTARVKFILAEIQSKGAETGEIMWDAGYGYFADQALQFRLKDDGEIHKYLIRVSCISSWYYLRNSINKIKIIPASGHEMFTIKKVTFYSSSTEKL